MEYRGFRVTLKVLNFAQFSIKDRKKKKMVLRRVCNCFNYFYSSYYRGDVLGGTCYFSSYYYCTEPIMLEKLNVPSHIEEIKEEYMPRAKRGGRRRLC